MTKQTAEIFAKNLNKYMKLYNMNQSDVARLTGPTHQVVSRWCSGKTLPRMVVCPCCGRNMSGFTTMTNKKNGGKYECPYYRCANAYTDMVCDFTKTIAQSKIEKQLLKKLSGFMEQYIVDCEVKNNENAKVSRRSESSIRSEMDRLNDMYLKGRISVESYDHKYEKLEEELNDISQAKFKPSDAVIGLQGINLQELYKSFSDEEKSAFWYGLIDDIFIDENKEVINIIFSK